MFLQVVAQVEGDEPDLVLGERDAVAEPEAVREEDRHVVHGRVLALDGARDGVGALRPVDGALVGVVHVERELQQEVLVELGQAVALAQFRGELDNRVEELLAHELHQAVARELVSGVGLGGERYERHHLAVIVARGPHVKLALGVVDDLVHAVDDLLAVAQVFHQLVGRHGTLLVTQGVARLQAY